MNEVSLFAPPLAFAVIFVAVACFSFGLSRLASRRRTSADGSGSPYACGEDVPDQMIQPDYGQFLPFAFFFTILHVVALMATTVPITTLSSSVIAIVYIACAIVGLSILYAR
jgi:NADH:ubiquinone oxidoreductase subunit 3 (subunit A)